MNALINRFLPPTSRRRAWAHRIYSQLAAFTAGDTVAQSAPPLTFDALADLELSLRTHYFNRQPLGYLETAQGQRDLANHLTNRLQNARTQIVPWVESVINLNGARVLEIGCGTGSGLVALAERGAKIIGVDLDEGCLQVARKRCALHGVVADLYATNATDVADLFEDTAFDLIILYASLEHMTYEERLHVIAETWTMLPPGKFWCVIETPNRLWHTDTHTSWLPFYHWLPDELAFRYARFSERTKFRECYDELTEERKLHFSRRGRGVSFHELQLALGEFDRFEVVSYKNDFLRRLGWLGQDALSDSYVKLLRDLAPDIHQAFLQEYLDLILRKPTTAFANRTDRDGTTNAP